MALDHSKSVIAHKSSIKRNVKFVHILVLNKATPHKKGEIKN